MNDQSENNTGIPRPAILLLLFLTFLNMLNFADRALLGNLAKQVHDDLEISYEMIGLLTGFGFVLFYTLMGVLLGMVADRWHRPRLMACGLALWSLLTAATGFARNLFQVACCRAFVGVGEATLSPSALSMLSDTLHPRFRAFASGFYYAGIPLGAGIGMIASSYILPAYGWRGCFITLGLAGSVFVLPLLLLKDPKRGAMEEVRPQQDVQSGPTPSFAALLGKLFSTLGRSPALTLTIIASSLQSYAMASGTFVLAWFQEERGFSFERAAEVGGWIFLVAGTLSAITGGMAGDWFNKRWSGGRLRLLVVANFFFTPLGVAFLLVDTNTWYFYVIWFFSSMGSMFQYGAVFSTVQDLAPIRIRATAVAFLIFCQNFLGSGPGPWVTGRLADNWTFTGALLTAAAVGFLSTPLYIIAAIRFEKDRERVLAQQRGD
jgi:MFS family permease